LSILVCEDAGQGDIKKRAVACPLKILLLKCFISPEPT
jgi:hypothetical protein